MPPETCTYANHCTTDIPPPCCIMSTVQTEGSEETSFEGMEYPEVSAWLWF